MAKVPAPKRRTTKGEPPAAKAAPANLDRPDYSGERKNLNFSVPVEWYWMFKDYAVSQRKSMIDVLFEAVEMHKHRNQGTK